MSTRTRPTAEVKARKRNEKAFRKKEVARLVLEERLPQYEIAKRLEIDPSAISRALSELRAEWREEAAEFTDQYMWIQIDKLEQDEKELHDLFMAEEDVNKRMAVFDRLLKVYERLAKLLGLDAPTKVAPTTPDGKAAYSTPVFSDKERMLRLTAIIQNMFPDAKISLDNSTDAPRLLELEDSAITVE